MGVLSSELRGWIVPGRAGVVTVVDAAGLPRIARIWAARALEGNDVIELCVQRAGALPVLEALETCTRVRAALNLIEVTTYRSRTFKGACELSPTGADPEVVDASVRAMGHAFQSVGMAADLVDRILSHGDGDGPRAMVSLRLAVESVFDQSPKPGAGAPL
jgi:hypothetical protein